MKKTSQYISPLGPIFMESDGHHLTGLWLEGQKYSRYTTNKPAQLPLPIFRETVAWLDVYFSGKDPGALPALKPEGSPFRLLVWDILTRIPYGQVVTYRDIANEIAARRGSPMAAQAVGGAVGHNPISIIIPCHRVVGQGGNLTGYGGGIDKKIALLKLERVDMQGMYVPRRGTAL